MSEALRLRLDAFGDSRLDVILEDVVRERQHQETKFPGQDPAIGALGTVVDQRLVTVVKLLVNDKLAAQKAGLGPGPTLRDILEEEIAELMACAPDDLDAQYDELIDVMASCALWAAKIMRTHGGQADRPGYLDQRGLAPGERDAGSSVTTNTRGASAPHRPEGLPPRHG